MEFCWRVPSASYSLPTVSGSIFNFLPHKLADGKPKLGRLLPLGFSKKGMVGKRHTLSEHTAPHVRQHIHSVLRKKIKTDGVQV